jgi:hypothetical protein
MARRARFALLVLACIVALVTRESAQAGAPNGHQFNLSVTNGAVVQLTVPAGTTFCTIGVSVAAVNYDVGTTATNAAPTTTTTGNGIQAQAGAVIQLGSFVLCRNWGAIAQSATATVNALYFR